MNADAMAVSMFWAGLLMVFAPLVFFGIVIAVWWRLRRRGGAVAEPRLPDAEDPPAPTTR